MGAKRRALLEVLYAKGTARTSELRRDADIPQGSKRYHFNRLRVDSPDDVDSWGYIREVDRVPSEFGGSDERVWALTSAGEEYVEQTLSVDPTTRDEGLTTRIERLERTVREQQAQIEEFHAEQAEAKEIASEARQTAEQARQRSEALYDDVNSRFGAMESRLRSRSDEWGEKVAERIKEVEQEINARDWQKDQIDRKFEQVDNGLDRVDAKVQRLRQELEEDDPKGLLPEWWERKRGRQR